MAYCSYLCRCLCHWPEIPGCCEETWYLVPDIGDIIRAEYEGEIAAEEHGWLFGSLVLSKNASVPKSSGWIPACAVMRMRPPGPVKRRAWDGEFYSALQWQEYYGNDLGLVFWEAAAHT